MGYRNENSPPRGLHYQGPVGISILVIVANAVPGGSTDQAIYTSFDEGVTWSAQITPAGAAYFGAASSKSRGEILALGQTGNIVRSEDGITFAPLVNDIANLTWRDIARNEDDTLYVAVGANAVDTIKTSPDGVTWTTRAAFAIGLARVTVLPGIIIAGSSGFSTGPAVFSIDGGLSWTAFPNMGLGATDLAEGHARSAATDGYAFATAGLLTPIIANSTLTAFSASDNLASGTTCMAYAENLSLYATTPFSTGGVYTSPEGALTTWTLRTPAIELWRNCRDMRAPSFGGFIGLRPLSGGIVTHRVFRSVTGLVWTETAPAALAVTATPRRLIEALL